jgi:hypothetical protein
MKLHYLQQILTKGTELSLYIFQLIVLAFASENRIKRTLVILDRALVRLETTQVIFLQYQRPVFITAVATEMHFPPKFSPQRGWAQITQNDAALLHSRTFCAVSFASYVSNIRRNKEHP